MLLKLREDYQVHAGAKSLPQDFHDTLLANGTVPIGCTARSCSVNKQ